MNIKVYQVRGEMNANITKGYLESFDIKSAIYPSDNQSVNRNPRVSTGEGQLFDVLVDEKDLEEAKEILKERENKTT